MAPFLGFGDALSGGHDPDDGLHISHTPKAVAALMLAGAGFLFAMHKWGGFQVVIGVKGSS